MEPANAIAQLCALATGLKNDLVALGYAEASVQFTCGSRSYQRCLTVDLMPKSYSQKTYKTFQSYADAREWIDNLPSDWTVYGAGNRELASWNAGVPADV